MSLITTALPAEPDERAWCRFCTRVIERRNGGAWSASRIGVEGREEQCPAAPNPDDGPMPGHEPRPGSVVTAPA